MLPSRLSIVVGTLNRLSTLRRCVSSIVQETRTPFVLYVTDAGSTDGTKEYLRWIACDEIVPILVDRKLGQAKAYNDVFRTVDTPYVAWLSDDNEIVAEGLDVAVQILDADDQIGMVGLKVKDVSGPFVKSPYIGGISSIGVLNVNQGVIRREVLEKVGYFSEAFGFYGIDPDLTAKVLYSGNDIVYTKNVAVRHYRAWPDKPDSPEYAAHQANQRRSLELYERKFSAFRVPDRGWERKLRWWEWIRRRLGPRYSINSDASCLGGLARDWHNSFCARHIRMLDPWISVGRTFHLRQSVPPSRLPASLPPDPEDFDESAPRLSASSQ